MTPAVQTSGRPGRSLNRRLLSAAVIVALTQGALFAASLMLFPSDIRPARQRLSELPTQIGKWTGVDAEVDERIIGALASNDILAREYLRADGRRVNLHIANWRDAGEWTPHPPQDCYTNNGWTLFSREKTNLADTKKAETQSYSKNGQRVRVLYWYQIGEVVYFNRDGGRPARAQYLGHRTRPPLFKVMLHSAHLENNDDADVLELAREIERFVAQQ